MESGRGGNRVAVIIATSWAEELKCFQIYAVCVEVNILCLRFNARNVSTLKTIILAVNSSIFGGDSDSAH